jgi:hypothetical protein
MDKMDAIDKIRQWAGNKTFNPNILEREREQLERTLSEGGWVHLDDKVEGKEIEDCTGVMDGPECPQCCEPTVCKFCINRTATIRDLIERE